MKISKAKNGLFAVSALAAAVSMASVQAGNELEHEANEVKNEVKSEWQEAKAATAQARDSMTDATRNAWLHGKLEATLLLNRHLNNFDINSKVVNGQAVLEGVVESEVDKDLAYQVALSIDGIEEVDNRLSVDSDYEYSADANERRGFGQRIEDATTTALVKSKLLANDSTGGLQINVDTSNDVVTLRGQVDSAEEKSLAEAVAENTDDVKSVVNELEVVKQDS